MSRMSVEPVGVRIENLTKAFASSKSIAVDSVSLNIEPGQLVTLLGPSGCGKTPILRMVSGFTMPTKGASYFGSQKVTGVPANKRDIGMMFQSYALFPHLSVYENVAYGLRVQHVPAAQLAEKVQAVLELMHIEEYQDRIPEQLSGGQQQRVALARAIVTEPKILLFDEPLSNLDAKMREYMREELRKIQQRLKITSIYVTHDQVEAMAISDQVVIMNKGRIEQIGTPSEIYVRPVNQFVADFMGKANFAKAGIRDASGPNWKVSMLDADAEVPANPALSVGPGQEAVCMIRPEFIRIDPDGAFAGIVRRATYFGTNMEYEIELAGQILIMNDYRFLANGMFREGDGVRLTLDMQNLRVLAP